VIKKQGKRGKKRKKKEKWGFKGKKEKERRWGMGSESCNTMPPDHNMS